MRKGCFVVVVCGCCLYVMIVYVQRLVDVYRGRVVEGDLVRHDLRMFLEGLVVYGCLLVVGYL